MINLSETVSYLLNYKKANDKKKIPGLASFANNLDGIQDYLEPLINFTYSVVPENMY